jgi:hypothetical protein
LADFLEDATPDLPVILPIQAYDLLMARMRDDAAFLRGLELTFDKNPLGRNPDLLESLEQSPSRLIASYDAASRHPAPETSNIVGYVSGTPEAIALRDYPKHRNRRLRRDPVDIPPDKPIQDEIAHHQEMAAMELA